VKKRDELTALQRWLERPRTEIDPSKLPASPVGRKVEGYSTLDELRAQWFSDKDE